jgi:AraC family transcriptional regulator
MGKIKPDSAAPPDVLPAYRVRLSLLGHLSSPRGIQIAATNGMPNGKAENIVTSSVTVFSHCLRLPADARFCLDRQPFRPIGPLGFVPPNSATIVRGSGAFTAAHCTFDPKFIADLAEAESQVRIDTLKFMNPIESDWLLYLGRAMFREAVEPGFAGEVFAEAMGISIALEIARLDGARRARDGPRRGGLAAWQMRRLEFYVREHLSDELTLGDLARLLGMSVRHLSRAVRREKGLSVHRWVADCRLQEARRLLADTDLPIREIARRSAFQSVAAFSTAFRMRTNFAPGEFRRLLTD